MMDRGIPLELWAHYVKQLKTAQRIAVEDSVLLLFSLKNFIHTLKAPKSFPKGKTSHESLECDTVENWSIDSPVFFVLYEKFPGCIHISLCAISHSLRVPIDDTWWNPEQLQEDSRDYLRLLIGLFETVLSGADAIHFRVLMKLFVKVPGHLFQTYSSLEDDVINYFSFGSF